MFDRLNYDDFCELVNEEFQLIDSEKIINLKLFELSEKRESPYAVGFSVLMKGNALLPQGIYTLKHETRGQGELFIVPIRQEGNEIVYESVFNRLNEN
jgi:hypothetical protein